MGVAKMVKDTITRAARRVDLLLLFDDLADWVLVRFGAETLRRRIDMAIERRANRWARERRK